jgi:hypothetical protein
VDLLPVAAAQHEHSATQTAPRKALVVAATAGCGAPSIAFFGLEEHRSTCVTRSGGDEFAFEHSRSKVWNLIQANTGVIVVVDSGSGWVCCCWVCCCFWLGQY